MFGIKKCIAVVLLISTASFCFSASSHKEQTVVSKSVPEWVDSPYTWLQKHSELKSTDYFLAVGSGSTLDAAQVNAVSQLASIFGQNVESTTVSTRKMEQIVENDVSLWADSSSLGQETSRTVAMNSLVCVEIAEMYKDTSGRFHALAVMDKQLALKNYLSYISKNEEHIKKLLGAVKKKSSYSIEDFARTKVSLDYAFANERYLNIVSVINFETAEKTAKSCTKIPDIKSLKLKVAQNIPVSVKVEKDINKDVYNVVAEFFTSQGFRVVSGNERYAFEANISFEENVTRDKSSVQCKYFFKGMLSDCNKNQVLFATSLNGRQSSISYEEAYKKALKSLSSGMNGDVRTDFYSFLDSLAAD